METGSPVEDFTAAEKGRKQRDEGLYAKVRLPHKTEQPAVAPTGGREKTLHFVNQVSVAL